MFVWVVAKAARAAESNTRKLNEKLGLLMREVRNKCQNALNKRKEHTNPTYVREDVSITRLRESSDDGFAVTVDEGRT